MLVNVPVLSKQAVSIFPASGTRNGSVQKMRFRTSATRLKFTANESMMGNSGGTTEVKMWDVARKSLKVERFSSRQTYLSGHTGSFFDRTRPSYKTYAQAHNAKTTSMSKKYRASRLET